MIFCLCGFLPGQRPRLGTVRPDDKEPFPVEKALSIIEEGRGAHFDPTVVDAFTTQLDAIPQKKKEYSS